MPADRGVAIVLVLLAMLGWTAYMAFWFFMLHAPPLPGAVEDLARTKLAMVAIWVVGLGIGGLGVIGLWRRTFDKAPRAWRVRLAKAGVAAAVVVVVAAYWFEVASLLVFGWPALIAGVLMLLAWASTSRMRDRLGTAVLIWFAGVALAAVAWFFATRIVGHNIWLIWALVSAVAVVWWLLPHLRPKRA